MNPIIINPAVPARRCDCIHETGKCGHLATYWYRRPTADRRGCPVEVLVPLCLECMANHAPQRENR